MVIIAKVEPETDAERFVRQFRQALDTSDTAIHAVHEELNGDHELYIIVFAYLTWKERSMIKDALGRIRGHE